MSHPKITQYDVWQQRVRHALQDGLGVEDIARNMRADVETVRREVSILRANGDLQKLFEVRG